MFVFCVFILGKKTIREIVSKVIYDLNLDPADFVLYILDSDVIRVVPFNFVVFSEDGFYFKGNFYPLYKILAIKDVVENKFLLLRDFRGFPIVDHVGFEKYDHSHNLLAIYDDITLIRNMPGFLQFIESNVRSSGDFSWFEKLGRINEYVFDEVNFKVVMDGPFRYIAAFFVDNSFIGILRIFLNLFDLSRFENYFINQRVFVGSDLHLDEIVSCIFYRKFLCFDNKSKYIDLYDLGLDRRYALNLLGHVVFLTRPNLKIVALWDVSEKKFLSPRLESLIVRKIGLDSFFDFKNPYSGKDFIWLKNSHKVFRVSDWDQIFLYRDY